MFNFIWVGVLGLNLGNLFMLDVSSLLLFYIFSDVL